ncbi:hypothetical protein B2G71_15730 [Novosphingobium sp. PC22D]|uniref:winged helix DNA-binding protein n=1 Tax=Novosphingobium sp. PC22D TaxID=1962403 RepID=UPI000BF1BA44|nr:winged helix DNA-binding protein [Novosphingobium sp. PC22D]PEQ11578.1 hypothetical protein B2G71_15730 [Novosphingobium sp. PC22D]
MDRKGAPEPEWVGEVLVLLEKIRTLISRKSRGDALEAPVAPDKTQTKAELAHGLWKEREMRARFFPPEFFGEAAWNVLLDLYWQRSRARPVSVTDACVAACVPEATALRWIGVLEKAGYLSRTADSMDARRVFLQLTDKSVTAMEAYLTGIADGGAGIFRQPARDRRPYAGGPAGRDTRRPSGSQDERSSIR